MAASRPGEENVHIVTSETEEAVTTAGAETNGLRRDLGSCWQNGMSFENQEEQ